MSDRPPSPRSTPPELPRRSASRRRRNSATSATAEGRASDEGRESRAESRQTTPDPPRHSSPPESLGTLLDRNNAEQELARYGYTPIYRLHLQTTGESAPMYSALYVRAMEPGGQTTFVELDVPTVAVPTAQDMTITHCVEQFAPVSLKSGMFEVAGGAVYGIALVCSRGICTLVHSDDGPAPVEHNFRFQQSRSNAEANSGETGDVRVRCGPPRTLEATEAFAEEIATADIGPVPYPIVRLSELRSLPEAVTRGVAETAQRLRTAAAANCAAVLRQTHDALFELNAAYAGWIQTQDTALRDLESSISRLLSIIAGYDRTPPRTEEEMAKLALARRNLNQRYELERALFSACLSTGELGPRIRRLTEQTNLLRDTIARLTANVGTVLS